MEKAQGTDRQYIALNQLHNFYNHPFLVRRDEAMEQMKESIRINGILTPVLVRPRSKGGYEIISGHRRVEAARQLPMQEIPCNIVDMNDDQAIVAMVDSNLAQRQNLPPSEMAFALRMRRDAARRIMLQTKGKSVNERATENVAREMGVSARQVSRLIKLTELNRQFLDLLDKGELLMEVGIELAHLATQEQGWIYDYIIQHNITLNVMQARKLRKAIQNEGVTEEGIENILAASSKTIPKLKSQSTVESAITEIEDSNNLPTSQPQEGSIRTQEAKASSAPVNEMDRDVEETIPAQAAVPTLDCERIIALYASDAKLDYINDDICRLIKLYQHIREFYPPDLPTDIIDEQLHKMLSAMRHRRLYGEY